VIEQNGRMLMFLFFIPYASPCRVAWAITKQELRFTWKPGSSCGFFGGGPWSKKSLNLKRASLKSTLPGLRTGIHTGGFSGVAGVFPPPPMAPMPFGPKTSGR
jgi:hypothetical protein